MTTLDSSSIINDSTTSVLSLDNIHKFDPVNEINFIIHFRNHHYFVHTWVLRHHSGFFSKFFTENTGCDKKCDYCKSVSCLESSLPNKCISFSDEELTFLDDIKSWGKIVSYGAFLLFLIVLYYPNVYGFLPFITKDAGISFEDQKLSILTQSYNSGKNSIEITDPRNCEWDLEKIIHTRINHQEITYPIVFYILTLFNYFECTLLFNRSENLLVQRVEQNGFNFQSLITHLVHCFHLPFLIKFKKAIIAHIKSVKNQKTIHNVLISWRKATKDLNKEELESIYNSLEI